MEQVNLSEILISAMQLNQNLPNRMSAVGSTLKLPSMK